MSSDSVQEVLSALSDGWRARVKAFMADAQEAARPLEVVRLTAMAAALDGATCELRSALRLPSAETHENESPTSPL